MKVIDPSGQAWRVTRRWVPWRRRLKGKAEMVEAPSLDLGDDVVGVLIGLVVVVLILPFVVIGVLALLEALALIAIFPLALLVRVLLGRHWMVEARRGWRPHWETVAGSWSESRACIEQTARRIESGDLPPQTLPGPPSRGAVEA